jgi:peptidoglycan-associated lipoprotein
MHHLARMKTQMRVFLCAASAALLASCASDHRRTPRAPAGPDFSEARSAETRPAAPLAASDGKRVIPPEDQLFFAYDSDRVDYEGRVMLSQVAHWLRANPKREVVVQGHADHDGDSAYNFDLSQRRAGNVALELQRMGIARDRIVIVAEGENQAILEPAAVNRRVVIFASAIEVSAY